MPSRSGRTEAQPSATCPSGHRKARLRATEKSRAVEQTEATWRRWVAQYGGMKADDARRLKELEQENARLKKIVAEQFLDIDILKELNKGNW
ncbi:hypothetical protein GCM10027290_30910 [Micromonospora sonneratiae]|uniref:Transposase n=1 Tax=Micromonospora sonneratiae TaxID=1184706 RepID=A0ABW3YCK3_9ACTN